ncbi:MAG: class I SAM-dependent DNA methyltransferase [Oscillospiraceae bacterium]
MNKEKCRRLWVTVEKLRGLISGEAIVRIMIYSLLLKYIEGKHKNENAFPFYDERYSVEYLSLTYGKVVSADDIKAYLVNAETELGISNGIISDGLYTLLSNSESEKIRIIFDEIKPVDTDSYKEYDKIAVYLLEQMAFSNGKTSGDHFTNLSVAQLIKKLLECQNGMTLYDGFCGYGVLASVVAGDKCSVFIQDISIDAVPISAILNVLKGSVIGDINCGDSLLNPMSNAMKYDRIVLDPPFIPRYDSDYIKNIPTDNYFNIDTDDKDSIFVRHAIAHMKEDGIAAVIVPMGLLFRSGRTGLAREIYASNYVDLVIELPSGIVPCMSVATAILILKKKKPDDGIFMINAKNFTERAERTRTYITASGIDEIVRIYKNREVIEGISNSVSHEKLLENEYNLCTTPYVNTLTTGYATESVAPYIKKYDELSAEVSEIDSRLTALRERFCK